MNTNWQPKVRINFDWSCNPTTYNKALKSFIAEIKQRFMHSALVKSMADIDSNMNKGKMHVHQHIQMMSELISLSTELLNISIQILIHSFPLCSFYSLLFLKHGRCPCYIACNRTKKRILLFFLWKDPIIILGSHTINRDESNCRTKASTLLSLSFHFTSLTQSHVYFSLAYLQ